MGADGGSIPRRDELVRTRGRDASSAAQDPALLLRALWTLCALSRTTLSKPIVSDATGRLYNKEAVVRFLLNRADPEAERDPVDEAVAGHLKGLKDLRELTLEPNPAYRRRGSPSSSSADAAAAAAATEEATDPFPFVCALTQKELNGKMRFVYLRTCGCVLAETGLRTVAAAASSSSAKGKGPEANGEGTYLKQYECPLCSKPFRASPAFFSNKTAASSSHLNTAAAAKDLADSGLATATTAEVEAALVKYDPTGDIVPLNPPTAEQDALRTAFLANRSATSSSKKRKAVTATATAVGGLENGTSVGAGEDSAKAKQKAEAKAARRAAIAQLTAELASDEQPDSATAAAPATKKARMSSSSNNNAPSHNNRTPAPQEKKEMSAAVRSIYGLDRPKDPKGESWMVRGTFNRYA